jgi:hypothetical protein
MAAATIALLAVLGSVIFPKTYKVATWYSPTPSARVNTGVTGRLGGQINADGTACFWLFSDGEDRNALQWPTGFSARGNPLRIVDQNGNLIGTVGEVVSLGGGLAPEDVIATGISGCPRTRFVTIVSQPPLAP